MTGILRRTAGGFLLASLLLVTTLLAQASGAVRLQVTGPAADAESVVAEFASLFVSDVFQFPSTQPLLTLRVDNTQSGSEEIRLHVSMHHNNREVARAQLGWLNIGNTIQTWHFYNGGIELDLTRFDLDNPTNVFDDPTEVRWRVAPGSENWRIVSSSSDDGPGGFFHRDNVERYLADAIRGRFPAGRYEIQFEVETRLGQTATGSVRFHITNPGEVQLTSPEARPFDVPDTFEWTLPELPGASSVESVLTIWDERDNRRVFQTTVVHPTRGFGALIDRHIAYAYTPRRGEERLLPGVPYRWEVELFELRPTPRRISRASRTFIILNEAPQPEITVLTEGPYYPAMDVHFLGEAWDPEDGALGPGTLSWVVRNNLVGFGRSLSITLPDTPGPVAVELQAVDSAGAVGRATVRVDVVALPKAEPKVAAVDPAQVKERVEGGLDASGIGNEATNAIQSLVLLGLISPSDAEEPRYVPPIEEAVAIFAKVLGIAPQSASAADAYEAMKNTGLISEATLLTRLYFAKLIAAVLGVQPRSDPNPFPFVDRAGLSAEDMGILAALYDLGIFRGYDDNTFRPFEVLTLAQVAVLVDRIVGGPREP